MQTAARIVRAARLDVGGIEYLETPDGRRVFYDINANSNLRPSVAAAFGFDPFERVVDFLEQQLQGRRRHAALRPERDRAGGQGRRAGLKARPKESCLHAGRARSCRASARLTPGVRRSFDQAEALRM